MDAKFWGKVALSTVVLGLVIFVFQTFSTTPDLTELLLPPVQPSATAQELQADVVLRGFEIEVPATGHIARAAFAINNQSEHDLKNIEIVCTLLDAGGNELGRDKWVIYNTLKAQTDKVFSHTTKMYISDRAASSQCRIVDMKKVTAPLIAIHRGETTGHGGHEAINSTMHGNAGH